MEQTTTETMNKKALVPFFHESNKILNIQNTMSLCLAAIALYSINDWRNGNINALEHAVWFVGIHAAIDLSMCTPDVTLHHLAILSIIFFKYYFQIDNRDDQFVISSLLITELSTVFYVAKLWMDQYKKSTNHVLSSVFKTIYTANDVVFFGLFFKLRWIDYYNNVLNDHVFHRAMWSYVQCSPFTKVLGLVPLYFGLYSLYGLNLYWGSIIMKKMFKMLVMPVLPITQDPVFTSKVLKFAFFFNIPIVVYYYSSDPKDNYLIDVIGVCTLSVFSYMCHNAKEQMLHKTKTNETNKTRRIELTHNEMINHYFNDMCAIQVRSFGLIFSMFLPQFISDGSWRIIFVSFLCHMNSILIVVKTFLHALSRGEKIYLDDPNDMFPFEMVTALPSVVNTGILIYNVDNIDLRNQIIFVTAWLYIMLRIEPFYKFSYVFFHVGLMMQTIVLCRMNTGVNPFPAGDPLLA